MGCQSYGHLNPGFGKQKQVFTEELYTTQYTQA